MNDYHSDNDNKCADGGIKYYAISKEYAVAVPFITPSYKPIVEEAKQLYLHFVEPEKATLKYKNEFKKLISYLVLNNAAEILGKTNRELFYELQRMSGLNRSTLHRYIKSAKLGIEL